MMCIHRDGGHLLMRHPFVHVLLVVIILPSSQGRWSEEWSRQPAQPSSWPVEHHRRTSIWCVFDYVPVPLEQAHPLLSFPCGDRPPTHPLLVMYRILPAPQVLQHAWAPRRTTVLWLFCRGVVSLPPHLLLRLRLPLVVWLLLLPSSPTSLVSL